jgi:hypothetical protein
MGDTFPRKIYPSIADEFDGYIKLSFSLSSFRI